MEHKDAATDMNTLLKSQFKDIVFLPEILGNPVTNGTEVTARGTNIANDPRLQAIKQSFANNLATVYGDPPYIVNHAVINDDEIILYMA